MMALQLSLRLRPLALAAALAAGLPRYSLAQCPDGTPPPCRPAVAARPAPRPDPRTWIVLPFANVSREPEIEWLRDASVSLLYLDLSRWQDIRVVDDGRIADLLRSLPEAQRVSPALEAGLGLARRSGAGRLVMGDLVGTGARTTVVAKVYDVASGRRLRTVSEVIPTRDSTMPAYSRLAGKVVGAPLPRDASRDAVGTSSLDAYQAYAAGLQALYSWQLDSARRHFERAIARDSSFALARYRLSVTLGWGDFLDHGPEEIEHALAAVRFSSNLPARERALISGRHQFVNGHYAEACTTYRGLLAADSLDTEAWYQLGECSFHDRALAEVSADSTAARFSGDWNVAYRAFSRVLELDPSMHLAYRHLLDMLRFEMRWGCLDPSCSRRLYAPVEVRNDSVLTEPRFRGTAAIPPRRIAEARGPRLQLAASVAERWLATAPGLARARHQYALMLQRMQRYSHAAAEIASVRRADAPISPATGQQFDLRTLQVHLLINADSANNRTIPWAVRLADSVLRLPALPTPSPDPRAAAAARAIQARTLAALAGTFGRFSLIPDELERSPFQSWAEPAGFHVARALLAAGVVPRQLDAVVARSTSPDAPAAVRAGAGLFGALCFGLCSPPPAIPQDAWRASPLGLIEAGDLDRARAALRDRDSLLAEDGTLWPGRFFASLPFTMALAHLALRDTAAALRALTHFDRIRHAGASYAEEWSLGVSALPAVWLLGRAWLLHGDLLRATGRAAESHLYYRRVVDLWSGGESEVQPFVERARAALPPGYLN